MIEQLAHDQFAQSRLYGVDLYCEAEYTPNPVLLRLSHTCKVMHATGG